MSGVRETINASIRFAATEDGDMLHQYTPSTTLLRKAREWPNVANTVPGVRLKWTLALAFIAFQESGHEEFPGERGQAHASGLAVVDEFHADHRSPPPRSWLAEMAGNR